MSDPWKTEIIELHEFFEGYFLGTLPLDALSRAESALHPDFTMTGPDGETRNRAAIVQMLHDGHGHTDDLRITTSDFALVRAEGDTTVAAYVERHDLRNGRVNIRQTTVVFVTDPAAPNGVAWRHAHETWIRQDQAVS